MADSPSIAIAAALIRRGGRILMVEQRGPGDTESTWSLPAGKVEPGESPVETIVREVQEETGLSVDGTPRLVFTAKYRLPDIGAWVAQTFECEASGVLQPSDPDGFVISAAWAPQKDALARLDRLAWYDAEPLRRWLAGEARAGASYEVP